VTYHHIKKLMYTVRVGTPNIEFGNMLLEQFGGDTGSVDFSLRIQALRTMLEESEASEAVDLCSGGVGPVLAVYEYLVADGTEFESP
jgi:Manganese containing catalase